MYKHVDAGDICREDVLKHFGYSEADCAPSVGIWPNNDGTLSRLGRLPEVLQSFDGAKKKIRIVFGYDPNFPKALIQAWGVEEITEKVGPQTMAVEIANTIVKYCREINKVLNSTDFTNDDIPRVQEMFRGLNHAASSYERIYRLLHSDTEPDKAAYIASQPDKSGGASN